MALSHSARKRSARKRTGATMVEFAVVASVTFFLILAMVVGAMGVFRYQEVAHLAREGSRYAATHGGQYYREGIATQSGVASVTTSSQLVSYLTPKATLLNSSNLTVTVSWSAPSSVIPINMPTYLDTDPTLVPPGQKVIQNYVTVTVSYQWSPELFLVGPFTLSSTSKMPMSY